MPEVFKIGDQATVSWTELNLAMKLSYFQLFVFLIRYW